MWKLLGLQSFKTEKKLRDDFWDPNLITYYYEADIPAIKKAKEEIGKVLWLDFITRLIKVAKNKKTLLWKEREKTWIIPFYITTHLDKMTIEEFQKAIDLLNKEIKKVKPSMKKELMIIRNNMLNKIKNYSSSEVNS